MLCRHVCSRLDSAIGETPSSSAGPPEGAAACTAVQGICVRASQHCPLQKECSCAACCYIVMSHRQRDSPEYLEQYAVAAAEQR